MSSSADICQISKLSVRLTLATRFHPRKFSFSQSRKTACDSFAQEPHAVQSAIDCHSCGTNARGGFVLDIGRRFDRPERYCRNYFMAEK